MSRMLVSCTLGARASPSTDIVFDNNQGQSSAHLQIIYGVLCFPPSLLLEKSHHPSEGNEKCNKTIT